MELTRVIIFTPDVVRLCDFYVKCFGLTIVGDADLEWAELNGVAYNIAFHRFSDQTAGRDSWIKLVFGTVDVRSEKQRLESLGVVMSEIVEFGQIQLCDGQDPDGNWFQISSRGM